MSAASRAGRLLLAWTAVAGAFFGAACAATPEGDAPPRRIRIGYNGSPNFGDLPSHLAHARLRADGYAVVETYYSGTDLAIDALARGDADIGIGSITGAWAAAAQGAGIRSIMEHVANPHRLLVVPSIGDCAALDGRRLALHGEAGVGTDLIRIYLDEECPHARPTMLYIQNSENRAAALIAGTIDAAAIELGVLHWLEEQAPGRFRVLVDFAARWPEIKTTGVQVNSRFAAAHPDVVVAYVAARLAANRDMMASPDRVVADATRVLGPSARWPRVARAYLDARAWAPDGGLREADVGHTLGFFSTPALAKLSAQDVADLRFLRDALASTAP